MKELHDIVNLVVGMSMLQKEIIGYDVKKENNAEVVVGSSVLENEGIIGDVDEGNILSLWLIWAYLKKCERIQ